MRGEGSGVLLTTIKDRTLMSERIASSRNDEKSGFQDCVVDEDIDR